MWGFQNRFCLSVCCCCLALEAFKEGHSLDHGWTASYLAHSSKGVCVCVCVCLCGPLDHARVNQDVAHFDWAGPEVLQWMPDVCDSVLLCVCCVGGCDQCRLGPVHNWDRSCPEQVLACACMRGLMWRGRTGVAPVDPQPAVQRKLRLAGSGQSDTKEGVRREGFRTPRRELGGSYSGHQGGS